MSLPSTLIAATAGRADHALAQAIPELSRRQANALCEAGGVSRAGKKLRAGDRVQTGETLALAWDKLDPRTAEERARLAAKAQDIVLLARGEGWSALRKPAGLPSVAGFAGDTLNFASMVAAAHGGNAALADAGLMHRLDNDTSGACLFAHTATAYATFLRQRDAHTLSRRYLALTAAAIPDRGEVTWPLGHHPSDDTRMLAVKGDAAFRGEPQTARTVFEVVRRGGEAALVSVEIWGGRRHQIRAHLAALGFPVLGDPIYGTPASRLGLHAARLHFVDPSTAQEVVVEADPGAHFWNVAPALRP